MLPTEPERVLFVTPLLEQETSYLADSERISIFLDKSIIAPTFFLLKRTYVLILTRDKLVVKKKKDQNQAKAVISVFFI
ncbi:hypothetical protein C240_1184 [Enterococcus sp. 5H]|nr:hypothetical protein [Enterococcus sp. 5H]